MRKKLDGLKCDLKKMESMPILMRATMIPNLVKGLLSLISEIIDAIEEVKDGRKTR